MPRRLRSCAALAAAWLLPLAAAAQAPPAATPAAPPAPEVSGPKVALPGAPLPLTVTLPDDAPPTPYVVRAADGTELATGTLQPGENTVEGVKVSGRAQLPLRVEAAGAAVPVSPRWLPGWLSILPPLLAIVLALALREVVVSLFVGVWLGALFVAGLNPFAALLRTVDSFALPALADADHAAIIIFSLMIGGMVGIIGRNGGTHGIVERLAPVATTRRRGMLATFAQGLAIFFDDYANTLIVGNTMRPVTDRLRISREKLAYIVDSTAAPVAAIVFVSTWVGYEISLIGDGLRSASEAVATRNPGLARELADASAFSFFIDTIPYLFYPLLALSFVFLTSWLRRDFGPMYAAERRAAAGEGVFRPGAALLADTGDTMEPAPGAPLRWVNAALPVLVVVAGVLIGLYASGSAALGPGPHSLREIFGEANPFHVLLWASLAGSLAAIVLTVGQRILTLEKTIGAWINGMRAMVLAIVILVLAWSLGAVAEQLGTAQFLSTAIEGRLPVHLLPVTVFLIAALVSFATGTSWGTMAVLIPLVIPLGAALTTGAPDVSEGHYTILLGMVSSVLAGSIFGDHCSPISDTTVLSSMASACDHVDHVRTQLPYALVVALVGMAVGDIPTAYGVPPWVSLAVGVAILFLVVRFVGRRVEDPPGAGLTPAAARAAAHQAAEDSAVP